MSDTQKCDAYYFAGHSLMAAQKLAEDQAKEPGELDRNLHSETNNSGWEMGEGKKG